jgi:NTE family protein
LVAIMAFLGGCAHTTNVPLCREGASGTRSGCDYDPDPASSYRFSPTADRDTLVIVTLSGGGTRAAALAFGTLQMLSTLEGTKGNSLLDQVDVLSSVSGGSVTAGWYALKGRAGLAEGGEQGKLWDFLHGDWTGQLAWEGLNPLALARYTFTPFTRSDVLANFFADHLYGDATFADVFRRYKSDRTQPYVILNATDLGHETIFPFTQGRFDLLCSDLLKYRLADAVAASANFPLAFSALGLQNFSGCPLQAGSAWNSSGPPQWLHHYDQFDRAATPAVHSFGLTEVREARLADDYLQSPSYRDRDKYIHLLDGGVSDNLGIRSTLAMEDDPARVPGLYLRLGADRRPDGYQNVSRVLYIVVNARTRDPGGIDVRENPPGEIKTALRMVDTQLDTSTLADQDFLIAELEAAANRATGSSNPAKPSEPDPACPGARNDGAISQDGSTFLSCDPNAQARNPAPKNKLQFYVVSVDFEMIPDKSCRDAYWLLGTNWGLKPNEIKGLVEVAKVILSRSPDLAWFYLDRNGQLPPQLKTPTEFAEPCSLVSSK